MGPTSNIFLVIALIDDIVSDRSLGVKSIDEEEPVTQERNGMNIIHTSSPHDPISFHQFVRDDSNFSTSHAISASNTHHPYNHLNLLLASHPHHATRLAQSAHTYFLARDNSSRNSARQKPLNNPFAPASISVPMAPSRRRWAHTFPIGPNKIPWHFHHLRQTEGSRKNIRKFNVNHCAHLFLSGTTKRMVGGSVSKHARYHHHHHQSNGNGTSRKKRSI